MKKLLTVLIIIGVVATIQLLTSRPLTVSAQTGSGVFVEPNLAACQSNIVNPVEGGTWCLSAGPPPVVYAFVGGVFTTAASSDAPASQFVALGTPGNGVRRWCSDCDPPNNPGDICTSSGVKTGAFADRFNGQWWCVP